jgi:hypothetical protein
LNIAPGLLSVSLALRNQTLESYHRRLRHQPSAATTLYPLFLLCSVKGLLLHRGLPHRLATEACNLQPAAGATEQIQSETALFILAAHSDSSISLDSGFTTTPTFGVSSAAIPPISMTNDISKTPSVATHLVLPSVSETPFTGAPTHLQVVLTMRRGCY